MRKAVVATMLRYTSTIRYMRSDAVLVVAPPLKAVYLTGILVRPMAGYRPPAPEDRWGWRDDLHRDLGALWVHITRAAGTKTRSGAPLPPEEKVEIGDVLSLMDTYWRFTHVDALSGLHRLAALFDFVDEKLRAMPPDEKGLQAMEGALAGARAMWAAYIAEIYDPTRKKLPVVCTTGGELRFVRRESGALDTVPAVLEGLGAQPLELEVLLTTAESVNEASAP